MAAPINIQQAKAHMRIDHDDEDVLIQSLIDAAWEHVLDRLGTTYDDIADVPASVSIAVKMIVAHWYENREAAAAQSLTEVPMAVSSILGHHAAVRL